jgi:hypothetical protein
MAIPMVQKREGKTLMVELIGYIGENSPLFDLSLFKIEKLVIDLGKVSYINSVGIKNWILWSRKIPKECQLTLFRVPPSIVNQINVVAGFLPTHAVVESILVPYYCDTCSKEDTIVYEKGKHYTLTNGEVKGTVVHPKDIKCGKSECTYTIDILQSKYFKFIKIPRVGT